MNREEFSQRVLRWFDVHGRKQLPWQRQPTPYRIWVSEIMLQQTQVATVIPYYQRFLARFPDANALADASLDEVLHLWSGLGYYARARNLHRSAVIIRDQFHGQFPVDRLTLCELPGIGRSTAGAILALAMNQRHAILDGNVKRVLTRFWAIQGWPGEARIDTLLWNLAETHTPNERVADYTQAMMDLGATVCKRTRPRCSQCPLADGCEAHAQGQETAFPVPRPRRTLPVRQTRMLLFCTSDSRVLLEKRPPTGIWGGLWSFPECPMDADLCNWCQQRLQLEPLNIHPLTVQRHSFSHYHLEITPVRISVNNPTSAVMEAERWVWYNTRNPDERGLAAPVQRLLSILATDW